MVVLKEALPFQNCAQRKHVGTGYPYPNELPFYTLEIADADKAIAEMPGAVVCNLEVKYAASSKIVC